MGTILESTKELAKRFGVENEEQTIKDQIDAITETIDANFNGSVDIASAVSEFAKNDNPDARLGTKLITENNTYVALDDELDGYSSVTVEVPSSGLDNPTYFMIRKTGKNGPFDPSTFIESQDIVELYQSDNGIVTIPHNVYIEEEQRTFSGVVILLGDVNRINITSLSEANSRRMIFKAGSDFDGLYVNDVKVTISATITTGLWYTLYVENNNSSYNVLIDEQYPTSNYTDSNVIPIS